MDEVDESMIVERRAGAHHFAKARAEQVRDGFDRLFDKLRPSAVVALTLRRLMRELDTFGEGIVGQLHEREAVTRWEVAGARCLLARVADRLAGLEAHVERGGE